MKMTSWFGKVVLFGLAALVFTAMPAGIVFAARAGDPPPPGEHELTGGRLELVWARQQRAYERLGRVLERADDMIDRVQELLDNAEADGKDVTALQAALDTFANAVEEAHAVYDEATVIVESQTGFDDDGDVTDAEQAAETVRSLAEKLEEIRGLIGRPGRAFHEAMKAFREAHRPPRPAEN
jgi:hypothetical protein